MAAFAVLAGTAACKKGIPGERIIYAFVSLSNTTGVDLEVSTDDTPVQTIGPAALPLLLKPGNHTLSVRKDKQLLLDTNIVVPPLTIIPAAEYVLFRPAPTAPLQLWSSKYIGMNDAPVPPAGYFTISIINADPQLPDAVDVHIFSTFWANDHEEIVEAGVVRSVSRRSFSPFTNIFIGATGIRGSSVVYPNNHFTVQVTNPETGEVLQNSTYINNVTVVTVNEKPRYIYSAYLAGNKLNTLLEK